MVLHVDHMYEQRRIIAGSTQPLRNILGDSEVAYIRPEQRSILKHIKRDEFVKPKQGEYFVASVETAVIRMDADGTVNLAVQIRRQRGQALSGTPPVRVVSVYDKTRI